MISARARGRVILVLLPNYEMGCKPSTQKAAATRSMLASPIPSQVRISRPKSRSCRMQMGGEVTSVRAVRLEQARVEEIWDRLVDNIPMYGQYSLKTDRQIKVYRLDRS